MSGDDGDDDDLHYQLQLLRDQPFLLLIFFFIIITSLSACFSARTMNERFNTNNYIIIITHKQHQKFSASCLS